MACEEEFGTGGCWRELVGVVEVGGGDRDITYLFALGKAVASSLVSRRS